MHVFVMVRALTVIAVQLARMTMTDCAGLAPLGVFWSHRESSKSPWTIKKNLSVDHLMLFWEKTAA